MEFIAIDMSHLTGLDESDQAQILAHFRDSGAAVMEATFRQLKEKGLYDAETMALKGVLLTIEETVISDDRIEAKGSKYRSAKGAVGVNVVVERVDGKWRVAKAEETWISWKKR